MSQNQNVNQTKNRVRVDLIVPLAVIVGLCFGLVGLDLYWPSLLNLNMPMPLKMLFILISVFCLVGIGFLAFPPKKKGVSSRQPKQLSQSNIPAQTEPALDCNGEESRGKGRPRKPCSLAQQGLVACPLADVTPEFPPLLLEKLSSEVTKKVAVNMLSVFDPERYNALMDARKAQEEEIRLKQEAAQKKASINNNVKNPNKKTGDDFLNSLVELAKDEPPTGDEKKK